MKLDVTVYKSKEKTNAGVLSAVINNITADISYCNIYCCLVQLLPHQLSHHL
jgi:hypothetical protein